MKMFTIDKPELGEKLKELRVKRKLTIKQVCKEVGIPESLLSNYESGNRETEHYKKASFEYVARLAVFYDVSLDYLAGRTTDKEGNADVMAVEERLGLTAKSQKKLERINRPKQAGGEKRFEKSDSRKIAALNHLLSSYNCERFLHSLGSCIWGEFREVSGGKRYNISTNEETEVENSPFAFVEDEETNEKIAFWPEQIVSVLLVDIQNMIIDWRKDSRGEGSPITNLIIDGKKV